MQKTLIETFFLLYMIFLRNFQNCFNIWIPILSTHFLLLLFSVLVIGNGSFLLENRRKELKTPAQWSQFVSPSMLFFFKSSTHLMLKVILPHYTPQNHRFCTDRHVCKCFFKKFFSHMHPICHLLDPLMPLLLGLSHTSKTTVCPTETLAKL